MKKTWRNMAERTIRGTKTIGFNSDSFRSSKNLVATGSRALQWPTAFARNMLAAKRAIEPHGTSPAKPPTLITPKPGTNSIRESARLTRPELKGWRPSVIQSSRATEKRTATTFSPRLRGPKPLLRSLILPMTSGESTTSGLNNLTHRIHANTRSSNASGNPILNQANQSRTTPVAVSM